MTYLARVGVFREQTHASHSVGGSVVDLPYYTYFYSLLPTAIPTIHGHPHLTIFFSFVPIATAYTMALRHHPTMPIMWLCFAIFLSFVQGHPAPGNEPVTASRSFAIGATRNPHYRPDGPANYVRALVKWGADIPNELADFVSNKGSGMRSPPFPAPPKCFFHKANRLSNFRVMVNVELAG